MAIQPTAPVFETGVGASTFPIAKLAGTFAFRFHGFTMENAIMYFLAGVGRFQLDAQGNLTGDHRSSITALQGQGAALKQGAYQLAGSIAVQDDGTGTASITFTSADGQGRTLDGTFNLVVVDADHLWFVSSGETLPPSGQPADELVNLEAVRMTPIQP
jgi:hypothetical protein